MIAIAEIFLGAMVVGFSGAMVPGPMFTLTVTGVAQRGFWASFFISLGHSILELLLVISFFLGILRYLDNPLLMKVIGILGGFFLLYLGGQLIYSVLKKKVAIEWQTDEAKPLAPRFYAANFMLKGAMVSLINPYWYIWWVSIGAAFMIKAMQYNIAGVSSFFFGHISADFIWFMFVGFLVSTGKRFLNLKVYRIILILCALFLLYLGIKFIMDFL
ncbi:MAG: LysE family transporter [Actinomycetota bacterium]|jgi:threonine/homoserine/homoserine lactone efflux protein|nr:LysE family transporter [Actinomycetota bacterium]